MRIFSILFFLLISYFPSQIAAQPDEGVRCVQAQLTAAGHNAGPTDGLLGPRTKSALKAFEKQNGVVTTRTFNVALGNSICRRIGMMRADLRQYWPSGSGGVSVIYADSIDEAFRKEFDRALAKPVDAVSSLLEVELAGRDIIVVAETAAELERLVKQNTGLNISNLGRGIRDACGTFRNFAGRTAPGIAYFCKSPTASVQSGIERSWLDFTIAHEFMHLAQLQLAGTVNPSLGYKARLDAEGSIWLIEGSAQAFGNRMALGTPDWDFRTVMYRRLEGQFPDLKSLESAKALEKDISNIYRAGTLAAIDLIDLEGYPAIMKMYELMGYGEPWSSAFQTAFSMSVEEYYQYYSSVRRFEDDGSPIVGPLKR